MTRVVSIDGNIGSGKSTFVNHLKRYYSNQSNCCGQRICFLQEPVDIWNTITNKEGKTMIECYYADCEKYAFSFQMMAYISRLITLKKELKKNYDIIFTERCVFTDLNVFCKMLYDDGKINEIEFQIYNKWFNEFIDDIPNIEYIYVRTSPQVAFDRILKRGRLGESIPLEYLTTCHQYHESWLKNITNKCIIEGDIDITNDNSQILSQWITKIDNYVQMHVLTFDGASRGNPGPCGIGWVIWKNKKVLYQGKHFVSKNNTNNYAEYLGLIMGLKKCNELKIKNLIVMGDSDLIIKQMNKEYEIRSPNLTPLHNIVLDEISEINYTKFIHIPRNKNEEADALANLAINKWGKTPYSPELELFDIPIIEGVNLSL